MLYISLPLVSHPISLPGAPLHRKALSADCAVGGLFANMSRKLDFLRDNLLINDSVLHNSHEFKVGVLGLPDLSGLMSQVKKLISCLSTCVFPNKVGLRLPRSPASGGR
jgi:hypothetical protein